MKLTNIKVLKSKTEITNIKVSPRSPKCNFGEPLQAKMNRKENLRDLRTSQNNFGSLKNLQRGAAAGGRRPLVCFSATQNCLDWCLSLVFFLSIHFGLQGRIIKLHVGDLGHTNIISYFVFLFLL